MKKIHSLIFTILLSACVINSMDNNFVQEKQRELDIILEATNKALKQALKQEKARSARLLLQQKSSTAKPAKKKQKVSSGPSGNSLSSQSGLPTITNKDFFEHRIELIGSLNRAYKIPLQDYDRSKDNLPFAYVCMIGEVIDIGKQ
jgi:hypothetical protein